MKDDPSKDGDSDMGIGDLFADPSDKDDKSKEDDQNKSRKRRDNDDKDDSDKGDTVISDSDKKDTVKSDSDKEKSDSDKGDSVKSDTDKGDQVKSDTDKADDDVPESKGCPADSITPTPENLSFKLDRAPRKKCQCHKARVYVLSLFKQVFFYEF